MPRQRSVSLPWNRYNGDGLPGQSELHYLRRLVTAMLYEPGSSQCRVLIQCKAQVETMLLALSRIEDSDPIRDQLLAVYQQLETLHDQYRGQGEPVAAHS